MFKKYYRKECDGISFLSLQKKIFLSILNFSAIFQQHPPMKCTFHNPYVILWLLCLVQWISRQSSATYTMATQTRLHCSWVEVYMAVNMNWLTDTKYQFLKRQWIFFFLLNTLFFPLSSTRVYRTWLWITWQVSYKKAGTVYHGLPLLSYFMWGPRSSTF